MTYILNPSTYVGCHAQKSSKVEIAVSYGKVHVSCAVQFVEERGLWERG